MAATDTPSERAHDVWAAGDAYEAYIGRWSRPVAERFLAELDAPRGGTWLDIGCGTGALSATILAVREPRQVIGVDPSEGFLATARRHVADPRAEFRRGEAGALPVPDHAFDAIVSGLVLNFVPDPTKAAAEMQRAARPGGTVAAYLWDYAEGMEMIRRFWDAATRLDPAAAALDEGRRFPLCQPDALRALFEQAGLRHVETGAIEVPTRFVNFDDLWTPFLGGQGPAPGYCMALDENRRAALREALRGALPAGAGGAIMLRARAWTVRGTA